MKEEKRADPFSDLLTRLVRVPKEEIDEQEKQYRENREEDERLPAKPGRIIPPSA